MRTIYPAILLLSVKFKKLSSVKIFIACINDVVSGCYVISGDIKLLIEFLSLEEEVTKN